MAAFFLSNMSNICTLLCCSFLRKKNYFRSLWILSL